MIKKIIFYFISFILALFLIFIITCYNFFASIEDLEDVIEIVDTIENNNYNIVSQNICDATAFGHCTYSVIAYPKGLDPELRSKILLYDRFSIGYIKMEFLSNDILLIKKNFSSNKNLINIYILASITNSKNIPFFTGKHLLEELNKIASYKYDEFQITTYNLRNDKQDLLFIFEKKSENNIQRYLYIFDVKKYKLNSIKEGVFEIEYYYDRDTIPKKIYTVVREKEESIGIYYENLPDSILVGDE